MPSFYYIFFKILDVIINCAKFEKKSLALKLVVIVVKSVCRN